MEITPLTLNSSSIPSQVTARASCDLCYNEAASEGEEFSSWLFDNDGFDSSATDEDGDYEPRSSRKRGGTPGRAVNRKKVKQEVTSPEDHDAVATAAGTGPAVTDAGNVSQACRAPNTHTQIPHTLPKKAPPRGPQTLHGQHLSWERLEDPEMELLGGGSDTTETTGKSAGTAGCEKTCSGRADMLRLDLFWVSVGGTLMFPLVRPLKMQ